MRIGIAFIFIALALFSCKKKNDGQIDISGIVTDGIQQVALSNVEVNIYVKEVTSGTYSNSYKLLGTTTTNSSGQYSLSFNYRTAIQYKIEMIKDGYYINEVEINPDDLSVEENNTQNLIVYPQSYLNLNITNATPDDLQDEILFSFINTDLSCPNCCVNSAISLQGMDVDTLINCNLYGGQYISYQYLVTKNSNTTQYTDSTFCPVGDTTHININY